MKLKTSEEIKNSLSEIFSEENLLEEDWNELGKLIGFMLENSVFIEALKLLPIEQMPIAAKSKAKHFIDLYDEQYFHYHYNKQMAESYQYNDEEI